MNYSEERLLFLHNFLMACIFVNAADVEECMSVYSVVETRYI